MTDEQLIATTVAMNEGGGVMAKEKEKGKESKEIAVKKPADVMPRWGERD
ncbi:MAG TPA: hypothetical protein VEI50_04855 [Nitrospiraceae bacterium]|nr:hypothetical protein [Nitrospiraceae bacterium]